MTGKASQSLKIKFKRSSKKVWDLSERPSNNQLLELYALFKQATDGMERYFRNVRIRSYGKILLHSG